MFQRASRTSRPSARHVGFKLLFEAWRELFLADLVLVLGDFAALRRRVLRAKVRTHTADPFAAERVCQALDTACVWYYKPTLCLERSAVLVRMLRRRGLNARLIIGTTQVPFRAHAWVRIEERIVGDRADVAARFMVLDEC